MGRHDRTIADLLKLVVSGTEVEVGVEARLGVVLHAVVLPAEAEVQGEVRFDLVGVRNVPVAVVKGVLVVKSGGPTGRVISQAGVGAELMGHG